MNLVIFAASGVLIITLMGLLILLFSVIGMTQLVRRIKYPITKEEPEDPKM